MQRLRLTSTSDLPSQARNLVRSSVLERVQNQQRPPTSGAQVRIAGLRPVAPHCRKQWRDLVKHWTALAAAGFIAAATLVPANAADISGAGATFPYPIYAKWADAYKKQTGNGLNYQSIGSGGGIKQIKAKTVTFGASDAPLKGKDLDEAGLAQFP